MPVPVTAEQFVDLIQKSNLIPRDRLDAFIQQIVKNGASEDLKELARKAVDLGLLTNFQAQQLLQGKWRGFSIGKYKVLERLGTGGMGSVYLCEHMSMHRKVAVKVLPTAKNEDPAALGRFYREARAAGALDHPNLVRAHDIDQDGELHFLVMDYVEGVNLQQLVHRHGKGLPFLRAAHYIYQSAKGLGYAHEQGLVHRDIKPANILLDRQGVIKILDLGLARFYEDNQDLLTLKYDDNNVLGTADYVSPEQAINSHEADTRTDIYSLGATFYFLLAAHPPFPEGKISQKLLYAQHKDPTPIQQIRPDIPGKLAVILSKMMAKDRKNRAQSMKEVIDALESFVVEPIPAPSPDELPQLSPAARMVGPVSSASANPAPAPRAPKPERLLPSVQGAPPHNAPVPTWGGRNPVAEKTPTESTGEHQAHDTPQRLARIQSEETLRTPVALAKTDRPKDVLGKPPSRFGRRAKLIAVCLTLLIGGVGGIGLHYFLGSPKAISKGNSSKKILVVSHRSGPGTFSSISAALRQAESGTRIEIREEIWEEKIAWNASTAIPSGVVIAGAAPSGAPVLWKAPASLPSNEPLLSLSSIRGLVIEGFILDGQGQRDTLVRLEGNCAGTTLQKLFFRGFRETGISLACNGEESDPVRCVDCRFRPANAKAKALALEPSALGTGEHIELKNNQIEKTTP